MHVAIFGGSFNPPHVAHQLGVVWVLATQRVDRVLVLPTPNHAFGKGLAPFEHRVSMTRLALRHVAADAVEVSTLEADLPAPTRTLHTLETLTRQHPGDRFSLVVGADILPQTPQWLGWDRITALATVVVMGRAGFDGPQVQLPDVSSSGVRARLAAGQAVDHLLDHAVVDYIREHNLYAGGQT